MIMNAPRGAPFMRMHNKNKEDKINDNTYR